MAIVSLESLGPYDLVYLSPHLDDAVLSCAGSLVAERRRGRRALVATLFTEGDAGYAARREEDARALELLGADGLWAGLRDAPFRSARYRSFSGIVLDRDPLDAAVEEKADAWLARVLERAAPRRLLAPLAVGGHVDHRLAYAVAARATGPERWFYEDRPYALVRGQVERRLRELGAAVEPTTARGQLRLAADLARAGYVRSYLRPGDALRAPWIHAHRPSADPAPMPSTWKAELVIESPDTAGMATQAVACYASQWPALFASLGQLERQTRRYSAWLSPVPGYVERRWRPS
jgi:LmbE family N-acetylglucosaminyl deacetylase